MDRTSKYNSAAFLALTLIVMIALALFAFSEDTREVHDVPLGGIEGTVYTVYLRAS